MILPCAQLSIDGVYAEWHLDDSVRRDAMLLAFQPLSVAMATTRLTKIS